MMLTMQGIGYIRGEKQVTKNGYYRIHVSCKANRGEWMLITIIYGESLNKYPMQYVKEGDPIYFDISGIKVEIKGEKYYISGFANKISMVTSNATQTSHTTQEDDIRDDFDDFGDTEVDNVPF